MCTCVYSCMCMCILQFMCIWMSEVNIRCLSQSFSSLEFWDRNFYWVLRPLTWLDQLDSELQGSAHPHPLQHWGYRCVLSQLCFSVDARDPNTGLQVCIASILLTQPSLQLWTAHFQSRRSPNSWPKNVHSNPLCLEQSWLLGSHCFQGMNSVVPV